MTGLVSRRLRAPLVVGGVGTALAIGVYAVAGWAAAVPVVVAAAAPAGFYYWLSGTDTDVGALIGARPDERQRLVRLWVRSFAGVVLFVLAAAGAVVSAAAGRAVWPYALIAGLGVCCFLAAAAFYRRSGRFGDSGLPAGTRLDERQGALLLHALQPAAIAMFLVAALAGVALSGKPGEVAFRVQALAFALAVVAGFIIFRPRTRGES
jgi:hypothetical protein